jgi:hypothetical protein
LGGGAVIDHASSAGKFAFWPAPMPREMLWFFAAWITMMLGSIPQQDIFQRVMSSISMGLGSWILLEYLAPDGMWPPQLAGLLMSLGGMLC